jgi:cysteine desulfurase
MSFSAHKIYGPKGIGALYVGERARPRLSAQIHGGGHEGGFRSGTLATHQIAAMGAAFELANQAFDDELDKIARLRNRLLEPLLALPGVRVNGSATQRIAHTLSLTFNDGEFDPTALGASLAFSATSACNSANNTPSHVLLALGLDARAAGRTIRLSLGRFTREQDIDEAVRLIKAACAAAPAFWATTS